MKRREAAALFSHTPLLPSLKVFHVAENEVEMRNEAAILIGGVARRTIMRKRYRRFIAAMSQWRRAQSRSVMQVFHIEIERQKKLEEMMDNMRTMRQMRWMSGLFGQWADKMWANHEMRMQLTQAVGEMESEKLKRLLKNMVKAWRKVVEGESSRLECKKRHEARLAEARERLRLKLEARGETNVAIDHEMVHLEMTRHLSQHLAERKRYHLLRQHFTGVRNLALGARAADRDAINHYKRKVLSDCFYPWTEWTYNHGQGLDRRRWKAPRRYEAPYNQRRVDQFARRRVLKLAWPLWRQVTTASAAAERLRRRMQTCDVRNHLRAWRARAAHQHALRATTVAQWRDVCARRIALPFRAWYLFVEKKMRTKEDQLRLITSYLRLKLRQTQWKILRAWRHQAIFGRIEGLYTRTELMKSLAEQKAHGRYVEALAEDHYTASEEMNALLEEEREKVRRAHAKLEERADEIAQLKMALHNAETEVARVANVVECVAELHPTITAHVLKMQPDFGFRDRGLAELARIRDGNASGAGLEEDGEEEEEDDDPLGGDGAEKKPKKKKKPAGDGAAGAPPGTPGAAAAATGGASPAAKRKSVAKVDAGGGGGGGLSGPAGPGDAGADIVLGDPSAPDMAGLVLTYTPGEELRIDHTKEAFLVRARWVLEQEKADFRAVTHIAGKNLYPDEKKSGDGGEGGASSNALGRKELPDVEPLDGVTRSDATEACLKMAKDMRDMYALWEFMRSGNVQAVPEKLLDSWEQVVDAPHKVSRKWGKLTSQATASGRAATWNDFRQHVNARLPKDRKSETMAERMSGHIVHSHGRADNTLVGLYGGSHGDRPNLYANQAVNDDFRPGTPPRWDV